MTDSVTSHLAAQAAAVFDVFWRHRSIRHFLPHPIPAEHLTLLMQAAQRASTDASAQMYTFVRISDAELRDKMAELAGNQEHIRTCAEYFIVCMDLYRLRRLIEYRGGTYGMGNRVGIIFGILDAGLAAENMAVAAEALGYGICFIGGVQNAVDEIARLLHLPQGVLPICGLCIGVPDPERIPKKPRPRLPQHVVFHENHYREYTDEDLEACYREMAPASSRGDWYGVLARYFAANGIMSRREAVMARAWRQQGLVPVPEEE